jgi:transposase
MVQSHETEALDGLRGEALLNDPARNKGTAFTAEERRKYGLEGLLPHAVENLDRQVERVMEHLDAKPNDLERYIYLIGLSDRNEILFYRAVMSDPARFIPILYDPTVADACLTFGHIYRRARGMYITREMKGRIAEVLRNWPARDVGFICVSTGGRILGLGDIGANGMGIPMGKLQLHTACAAVPPDFLLPILFDIGTTNAQFRADPLYLGVRVAPPSEEDLDALTEEFVEAVQQVFPGCCIHFEDWKGTDAIRMLNRYADKVLIYVYGYINQIASSRRLERETHRNVELMWLTGRLTPDFKTIADFRKDNGPAIRGACRQFIVLCRQLGLFAHAVAAIDGSKFKAVNARDKNFTKASIQRRMEQVEACIKRYWQRWKRRIGGRGNWRRPSLSA